MTASALSAGLVDMAVRRVRHDGAEHNGAGAGWAEPVAGALDCPVQHLQPKRHTGLHPGESQDHLTIASGNSRKAHNSSSQLHDLMRCAR